MIFRGLLSVRYREHGAGNRRIGMSPERKTKQTVMGYTHYIYQKRALTDDEWTKLCAEAQRILAQSASSGIALAGPDGSGTPIVDKSIQFNGAEPLDHESFILTQQPDMSLTEFEPGEGRFSFCKTALKPYDSAVVAVLQAAKRIAPGAYKLSSDGDRSNNPIFPD